MGIQSVGFRAQQTQGQVLHVALGKSCKFSEPQSPQLWSKDYQCLPWTNSGDPEHIVGRAGPSCAAGSCWALGAAVGAGCWSQTECVPPQPTALTACGLG